MAWIQTVPEDEATGPVAAIYQASQARTGRIFNIVRAMSPNARSLRASLGIYQAVMFADSPLSRGQRECLAVIVSRMNGCRY